MFWFILLRVSTVITVCKYAVQSGHNFRWNFLRSRFLYSLCAVKLEDWPLDNRYETRMRTKLMIERFRRSESNYVKTSTATLLLHSQGKPGQITDSRGLSTQTLTFLRLFVSTQLIWMHCTHLLYPYPSRNVTGVERKKLTNLSEVVICVYEEWLCQSFVSTPFLSQIHCGIGPCDYYYFSVLRTFQMTSIQVHRTFTGYWDPCNNSRPDKNLLK